MQPLAAIIGPGEAATPEYVARRKAIEARHGANDDGTLREAVKAFGYGNEYDDTTREPLDDHDLPERLVEWGLPIRYAGLLIRNGCEEIADVRSALLRHGEIAEWPQGGEVSEREIRRAMEKADYVDQD